MTKWLSILTVLPACMQQDINPTSTTDLPGLSTTALDTQSFTIAVQVYGHGLPVLRYFDGTTSTVATIEHRFEFAHQMPDRVTLPVSVGNIPLVINARGCADSKLSSTLFEHVVIKDFAVVTGGSISATIAYDCFDSDGTQRTIATAPITFDANGDSPPQL